jgi:tetratricopeptide (TPR) repeat protein
MIVYSYKIAFCFVVISLLCCNAAAQTPRTSADLLTSSDSHFRAGDLDAALADVDKAIKLDPRNINAYWLRAAIRNRKNPESDNSDDWDKIIELGPAPAAETAYLIRANFRLRRCAWDAALADLNQLISINPRRAVGYSMRSYTYLMKGDLDRARLDYDKSSELDPREDSPFVRRGYALCLKRQFDAAEADYANAIEWKSDYAVAYAGRGLVRGLRGNISGSLTDIRKAADLDSASITDGPPKSAFGSAFGTLNVFLKYHPTTARAYEMRGIFHLFLHKEEEATADFLQTLTLDPTLKSELARIVSEVRPK